MTLEGKLPSIRQLAKSLEYYAMAIYYYIYIDSKNILLETITVSLIQEIYQPKQCNGCQEELKLRRLRYLKLLNEYPDLLETLLGMASHGSAIVFIEHFHIDISPLNLAAQLIEFALDLFINYLYGVTFALNCTKKKTWGRSLT